MGRGGDGGENKRLKSLVSRIIDIRVWDRGDVIKSMYILDLFWWRKGIGFY